MRYVIVLLMTVLSCCAGSLPNNFVNAIHQVETSGHYGPIWGDNHKAFGPLQIHKQCWKDSKVAGSWMDCQDYDYSVHVMNAYLSRFGAKYIETNDYQSLARIWNSGPTGKANPDYWKKVKKVLTNQ